MQGGAEVVGAFSVSVSVSVLVLAEVSGSVELAVSVLGLFHCQPPQLVHLTGTIEHLTTEVLLLVGVLVCAEGVSALSLHPLMFAGGSGSAECGVPMVLGSDRLCGVVVEAERGRTHPDDVSVSVLHLWKNGYLDFAKVY